MTDDTTYTPVEHDGPVRHHPWLAREKFHIWITSEGRAPFPVFRMPNAQEMRDLLNAVEWPERVASVRFQVPVMVLRHWLGGGAPTEGAQEYSVAGIQAAWSALAWASGLSPAGEEVLDGGERSDADVNADEEEDDS